MLLNLLTQHPEALPSILGRTPTWVWGLLAGLIALGASQMVKRQVGIARVALLPLGMVALSCLGLGSAFSDTAHMPSALGIWLLAASLCAALAMAWRRTPSKGTHYNAQSRQFTLPGSPMPLLLILAIFLTKYSVAIELAMQPALAQSATFALSLAAVYGLFNGLFAARTLRLWRQTRLGQARPASTPIAIA
ncbi:MAG: DUF6622 family protein [Hydrogenophaga sp.]